MMKFAINQPGNHEYSVMQRVIDGDLKVNSIEEFEDILEIYPNDPLLQRKFADLLMDQSQLDKAITAFDQSATLFIGHGMNLQAIVAKILQWSIQKPTHDQGRAFHALLHEKGSQHTPLQRFWARMSYAELVSVMLRLVRVRLATGDKIASIDEPANEIYFVVDGALAETLPPECLAEAAMAGIETEPLLLGPNDVFGDIFPLDQATLSDKDIVAISDVELVKISKKALLDACQKHPPIENLLGQIRKPENRATCDRSWQTVRRAIRYGLPTKVEISNLPTNAPHETWQFTGIAEDLSLGGACVDLGTTAMTKGRSPRKGQRVTLQIDLLNEVATLTLNGCLVWVGAQEADKGSITCVGVRFDPLTPTDRELLSEYCAGNIGEQNLLWGLWDSMVRTDNSQK
jgi:CRP-like cAMP-binding protein